MNSNPLGSIPAGHHWADWRSPAVSRNGHVNLAMSATACSFLKSLAVAAKEFSGCSEQKVFLLNHLEEADRKAVLAFLGDGECRAEISSLPDTAITETSFSGIWKINDNNTRLEIGEFPAAVSDILEELQNTPQKQDIDTDQVSEPMALATITDITAYLDKWKGWHEPGGISLSKIPYSSKAQKDIIKWLGKGEISFEITGFFNASITLTSYYPAWYYCYRDKKSRIQAAGIEITPIPDTVAAPVEDIRDSGQHILSSLEDGVKQ